MASDTSFNRIRGRIPSGPVEDDVWKIRELEIWLLITLELRDTNKSRLWRCCEDEKPPDESRMNGENNYAIFKLACFKIVIGLLLKMTICYRIWTHLDVLDHAERTWLWQRNLCNSNTTSKEFKNPWSPNKVIVESEIEQSYVTVDDYLLDINTLEKREFQRSCVFITSRTLWTLIYTIRRLSNN